MDYTEKYHLPQWVEEDRIQMKDFNEAMENIEKGLGQVKSEAIEKAEEATGALETAVNASLEALETEVGTLLENVTRQLGSTGHNLRIETGSYAGNDRSGEANKITLRSNMRLVMAMVFDRDAANRYQGFVYPSDQGYLIQLGNTVSWTENSVSWYAGNSDYMLNYENHFYYYILLGYDA